MSLSCLGHHLIVVKQRINVGVEHAAALDYSSVLVHFRFTATSFQTSRAELELWRGAPDVRTAAVASLQISGLMSSRLQLILGFHVR